MDRRRRDDVLITATELAALLADGDPVTILDVRWQLTEPDGRDAYERGHIPGAVYVSLEDELSDHSVEGRGRHPLPSGRAVEAAGASVGGSQGRTRRRLRRLEPGRLGPRLVGADRSGHRERPHPRRGIGGLGGRARERTGDTRARRRDGASRGSVRRCASHPDGRDGDGRRHPARCAGTGAIPRRCRADRSGRRTHSRRLQRAEHRLPGRRRHVPGRRRISRGCSATSTASAPTAAPASPRPSSWPPWRRSASTQRCIPGRGRNGLLTQRVPSKRASTPARCGGGCRPASTAGRSRTRSS